MIVMRSLMLLMAIVASVSLMDAQSPHTLDQGIQLVIGPLDQFSRAFGLQDDKIEDAAERGITSSRWSIHETSTLIMSVTINALSQQEEDRYTFRIEVHGSSSPEIIDGHEDESWVICDVSAVKTIDVAWNDYPALLAAVGQLTKNVSKTLYQKVTKQELRNK
jgi:hypothetical protein